MRQLLIRAFEDTVAQMKADAAMMPLTRWNESVFRFVYSQAVTKWAPDVMQYFECNRIDLVLHRATERAFMEFKFYLHTGRYDPLCGNKIGWKGGPSRKNYQEFKNSVRMLRRDFVAPKLLKLVALFYSDPVSTTRREKYDTYYGDSDDVARNERKLLKIRRLASIGPFPSNGSESICYARLYEVRT